MRLRDCTYGVLVVNNDGEIGMVKGITNNAPTASVDVRKEANRAIPMIEWASGSTHACHYDNLSLLK